MTQWSVVQCLKTMTQWSVVQCLKTMTQWSVVQCLTHKPWPSDLWSSALKPWPSDLWSSALKPWPSDLWSSALKPWPSDLWSSALKPWPSDLWSSALPLNHGDWSDRIPMQTYSILYLIIHSIIMLAYSNRRGSPDVACWTSDHWVAGSNPAACIISKITSLSPASAWPSLA